MEKKKRKRIFRSVIIAVILFFYFLGLNYFGSIYRQTHKHENSSQQKYDTLLLQGWKYHLGDNHDWAKTSFNDSAWIKISREATDSDSFPSYKGELAWFRLHLKIDSSFVHEPCVLVMQHYGASEIFWDGEKIASFGNPSAEKENEKNIDPEIFPVNISFGKNSSHVIAVRYSDLNCSRFMKFDNVSGFTLKLRKTQASQAGISNSNFSNMICCAIGIFLLTIAFLHFLLYIFYRKASENISYSLF